MRLLETINNGGVYIIAEMSANHAGDFDNAIKIIHAAKEAGADCLKIQTYTADSITIDCDNDYFKIKGGLWDGRNLYDLYKEASTPYEWQSKIKDECEKVGIDFLSTPFDLHAVDFLENMGAHMYKVASFELVDIPLIRYIAKKGKPMIVSCGMGSEEEINDAVEAITGAGLPKDKIVLLKCTSEYPAKISDMNLQTITHMKNKFGVNVGLSDHSLGSLAPVAAVSLGACVVEKHFCLSRKIKNADSDFSSEPDEFKEMAELSRQAAKARGQIHYGATEDEKQNIIFRKSIFSISDISKGDVFSEKNIKVIRPGYGMKPKHWDSMLGKKSSRDYKRGEPLNEEI